MNFIIYLFIVCSFLVAGDLFAQEPDSKKLSKMSLEELEQKYSLIIGLTEKLPYSIALTKKTKEMYGKRHLKYIASINELSFLYYKLGKFTEAEPIFTELLEIRKEMLGVRHPDYLISLNNLGSLFTDLGKFSEAEHLLVETLNTRREVLGEKHPDFLTTLNNLAHLYLNIGEFNKAEPLCKETLLKRKEILGEDHPDYAVSLNNLAFLYNEMGKFHLSEPLYIESLKIKKHKVGEYHPDYALSLNNLANLYQDMGKYQLAEKHLEDALNIRKSVYGENHPIYATNLNDLGNIKYYIGKYDSSEILYKESLKIKKILFGDNKLHYLPIINNLANLYNTTGKFELAEFFLKDIIFFYKSSNITKNDDYSTCILNLANLYTKLNRHKEAEALFIESLEIRKTFYGTAHPEYAKVLNNLAYLYEEMGKNFNSEGLYTEALNINKISLGVNHPEYATNLNNLGSFFKKMGNYSKSEVYLKQALNIQSNQLGKKHPSYAVSLSNLANLYFEIGDFQKAEILYAEAWIIFLEIYGNKHPIYTSLIQNLAELYAVIGNLQLAEHFYKDALNATKENFGIESANYARSLNNMGLFYQITEKKDSSLFFYQDALKIRKDILGELHPDYSISLNNLAYVYKELGKYNKADSLFTHYFSIAKSNLSQNFTWLSEKGKAAYWQKEKVFFEGLNEFAAEAAPSLPRATELAYNSNLLSKGILLETSREIEDAVLVGNDPTNLQVFESLKQKRNIINHLISSGKGTKEVLEQYETEADSLDRILLSRLGEYAAFKKKFQIGWKEVEAALGADEAAIEFARFYNRMDSQFYYQALLLRKGYEFPKLIKLGKEKEIADITPGSGFPELYGLIWEPIDSHLYDIKTVYYSPAGILNNISFSALCNKGKEKAVLSTDSIRGKIPKYSSETTDCTYLADRYSLHQLSTTRYLAEDLEESNLKNTMLIFGGINYDNIPNTKDTLQEAAQKDHALMINLNRNNSNQPEKMSYLPGTLLELQSIQKTMGQKSWKVTAYADINATENRLKSEIKKESPGILHIATHGFAFPDTDNKGKSLSEENRPYREADNPMVRCGLLFSGGNYSWTGQADSILLKTGEDGILTALEVSNLRLENTKLVVLSACETGLGKIDGTEGTFGLKRGFKLAGVDQIIVSLWSVPDKETMELMDIFYIELSKTQNAVKSFEKAQKDMRFKYPTRPDLWAGFVFVR